MSEPSLMMFSEPLVLEPRPAFVPFGTAGKIAAVGQIGWWLQEVDPLVSEHAADHLKTP